MNPDIIALLRVEGNHWLELTPNGATIRVINVPDLAKGVADLDPAPFVEAGLNMSSAHKVLCFYDGKEIIGLQSQSIVSRWLSAGRDVLQFLAQAKAERFRRQTKTLLLEQLSAEEAGNNVHRILQAFQNYTFFSGFSCWLYNCETKCYTILAASFSHSTDVLNESDVPEFDGILEQTEVLHKELSQRSVLAASGVNTHFQSVEIFSVSTADSFHNAGKFGIVVCLFSETLGYHLRKKTVNLIRASLSQTLALRYFNRITQLNELRAKVRAMREFDDLEVIANEICRLTAIEFSWETCSVFLKAEDGQDLLLTKRGSYPTDKSAVTAPVYRLGTNALTVDVFQSRQIQWSYDVANDPRNSHTHDEATATPGKNWIGVPIIAQFGQDVLGVLRVKNRVTNTSHEKEHFTVLDMYNLHSVASDLASIIYQHSRYSEKKHNLERRAKEVQELTDFLRTFRHEIRSPIQAVCFAPDRLRLLMRDENLIPDLNHLPHKLRDYLDDLQATGSRLEMISKALTLDPEDIVKSKERHSLYRECIAPVLAFTISHARKHSRRFWHSKDSLSANVTCDATAISMAFHVLVDNAIKYSDKNSLIKVYGQRTHDGTRFRVLVENTSSTFGIQESEMSTIFQKYHRGIAATTQKMEGSGIGLYLAKKIAELNGGRVFLVSRTNPITFALEVPLD